VKVAEDVKGVINQNGGGANNGSIEADGKLKGVSVGGSLMGGTAASSGTILGLRRFAKAACAK